MGYTLNSQSRGLFHKITAVGFIILTLSGNFWLVFLMMNKDAPLLVMRAFEIGMITVAVGGFGMLIKYLQYKLSGGTVSTGQEDE